MGHRLDLVRLAAGPDRRVPHVRDHRGVPGAFGYPALTPAVKERILGANAIELFGIVAAGGAVPAGRGAGRGPRGANRTLGPVSRRDVVATFHREHPWIASPADGSERSERTRRWGGDRYRDRRMFVKICGITNEDDALLAVAMGADAVGFVFAPSPRQIAVQQAYDITRRLPPEILTVGVFRDEHPKRVVDLVNRSGVKAAQLHGSENADVVAEVARAVKWVIKAYPAGSPKVADAGDAGDRPDHARRRRARARGTCSTGRWPARCPRACA